MQTAAQQAQRTAALREGHRSQSEAFQRRFDELVEDLEWTLPTRGAREAAFAVGYSNPASLARRLDRWGRHDLAQHFWRLTYDDRYNKHRAYNRRSRAKKRIGAEVRQVADVEDTVLSA